MSTLSFYQPNIEVSSKQQSLRSKSIKKHILVGESSVAQTESEIRYGSVQSRPWKKKRQESINSIYGKNIDRRFNSAASIATTPKQQDDNVYLAVSQMWDQNFNSKPKLPFLNQSSVAFDKQNLAYFNPPTQKKFQASSNYNDFKGRYKDDSQSNQLSKSFGDKSFMLSSCQDSRYHQEKKHLLVSHKNSPFMSIDFKSQFGMHPHHESHSVTLDPKPLPIPVLHKFKKVKDPSVSELKKSVEFAIDQVPKKVPHVGQRKFSPPTKDQVGQRKFSPSPNQSKLDKFQHDSRNDIIKIRRKVLKIATLPNTQQLSPQRTVQHSQVVSNSSLAFHNCSISEQKQQLLRSASKSNAGSMTVIVNKAQEKSPQKVVCKFVHASPINQSQSDLDSEKQNHLPQVQKPKKKVNKPQVLQLRTVTNNLNDDSQWSSRRFLYVSN